MNIPVSRFMTVNRFLYETLIRRDIHSMAAIAKELKLSENQLRANLIKYKLPTSTKQLQLLAAKSTISNAPPVYSYLITCFNDINNFSIISAELLIPVEDYHFDYMGIYEYFLIVTGLNKINIKSFTKDFPFGTKLIDAEVDKSFELEIFTREMLSYYNNIPQVIQSLNNDDRFRINSFLSPAFLYGVVNFPTPGISSPHLTGAFTLSTRKANTGYLSLDPVFNSIHENSDISVQILKWLADNNNIYKDYEPITLDNYKIRIDPTNAPSNESVSMCSVPNHEPITNQSSQVLMNFKTNEGIESRWITLEEALVLVFPMLFPFGKIPDIPGKTFRKKAKAILSVHPFFRCGRLQCHLVLFLYNLILDHDTNYQSKLSIQHITVPEGSSRKIPDQITRRDDPAFPSYWATRQSYVRAMCSQYGDPDLMLTFTFVNNWKEVQETQSEIKHILNESLDMRFCPFETLKIWKNRIEEITKNGFEDLIENMSFGTVAHYTWRLEFQARGAPHIHSLIWLKEPLKLAQISKVYFATIPSDYFGTLKGLVKGAMVHTCYTPRCKKGIESGNCKYGFPKSACSNIHVTASGELCLPRREIDANIVEYHPVMLLTWGGHCHMHVLRCEEHPNCSQNAIHYIVKYNFKNEPSLRIQVKESSDNYRTAFHSRIISAEEAMSRILGARYFSSDSTFLYIPLQRPVYRKAVFKNSIQVQISMIDKYFRRPLELERIGILDYFSQYDIKASKEKNIEIIREIENFTSDKDVLYILTEPEARYRPRNTLVNDEWENLNCVAKYSSRGKLLPNKELPDAHALEAHIRKVPQIVLTEKFSPLSDMEHFAYVYLLLNGSWRSDSEMKSGESTWVEALRYHGLLLPRQELTDTNELLLIYMLKSPKYSIYDICRNVSAMENDLALFIRDLKIDNKFEGRRSAVCDYLLNLNTARSEMTTIVHCDAAFTEDIINQYINYTFSDNSVAIASEISNEMVANFNSEQELIYNNVISRLINNQQVTGFISGRAGTGKSYLINAISNFCISNRIPYLVCASTGIAAQLIKGRTLHSALALFTKVNGNTEECICSLDIKKPNGYSMTHVKLLIIDEITMIPAKAINAMDKGLKRIIAQRGNPNHGLLFGGISVLLFGDLAQVPAVTRSPDDYWESIQQFTQSQQFSSFITWELTTLMRQDPNEKEFACLLEYIRNHHDDQEMDESIENLLKDRFIPGTLEQVEDIIDKFVEGDSPEGMVVTFKNRTANDYNEIIMNKRIRQSGNQSFSISALYFIRKSNSFVSDVNQTRQEGIKRQAELTKAVFASESDIKIFNGAIKKKQINTIVPFNLRLCVGSRVMLLKNLNMTEGLINGARGTVISYNKELDTISVMFDFQNNNEQPVLITRRNVTEYQMSNGSIIFMFQFPIKLSWAVTAHKCQGQTLNHVAINIGENAFAHGAFYVALSRVRSLNNILLFGMEEWKNGGPVFHNNVYIQEQSNQIAENSF